MENEENRGINNTWVKIASTIIVLIVSGVGAVVLERMGDLQTEIGSLSQSVDRVKELDQVKERIITLEIQSKSKKMVTDHAQLSSAVSQYLSDEGVPLKMEFVDSISGIEFNPRRSSTDIKIKEKGEYLFLIAPQVQRIEGFEEAACIDVWLRINGDDLANSSVRQCWSKDTDWDATSVLLLQATLPMKKNDTIQIMGRSIPEKSVGIIAIKPDAIPIIPSIIVSVLRVGGSA